MTDPFRQKTAAEILADFHAGLEAASSECQTGRTSRQIMSAPAGSVFVWGHDNLDYPVALAKLLLRPDIIIVGQTWLDRYHLIHRPIFVDHDAALTERQARNLKAITARRELADAAQ